MQIEFRIKKFLTNSSANVWNTFPDDISGSNQIGNEIGDDSLERDAADVLLLLLGRVDQLEQLL